VASCLHFFFFSLQSTNPTQLILPSATTMEDDDGDGYSSSGSSTHSPDDTVPDSQPPRGGHILESSPIRATSSSRYPLQSTPEWDQAHLEQERQQRIRFRQQLAGNSSQSSQHRQAQQQQVSSSAQQQQQQAQAHQITTSCAQPTASASTVKLLLRWLDQMQPRLIPLLLLLQSRREVV
jgi:hypothetical protein